MDRLSACCNAPMTVESSEPDADYPTTNWYCCESCGEPCDPVVVTSSTPLRDGGTATLEGGEMHFTPPVDEGADRELDRYMSDQYEAEDEVELDNDPGPCESAGRTIGRYLDGIGRWMKHTLRLLQRRGID